MTKTQILGALAESSGPMTRAQLETKLGESYRNFQGSLDYYKDKKRGWIEEVADHTYILAEKGREELLKIREFKDIAAEPGLRRSDSGAAESKEKPGGDGKVDGASKGDEKPADETSEESLGTTEYQHFLRLGKQTGVYPLVLIKQTADHIWDGGDYRDLKWVAQGLAEMGIRSDLFNRWFHSWRSYLKKAMPSDLSLEGYNKGPGGDGRGEGQTDAKKPQGKRDYIIGEDDLPVKVGDGLGDLDYQDAIDLAKIRASRSKAAAPTNSIGTMADEITKIFHAFKETMGDRGEKVEGKNFLVKPSADGYVVEEVESGKPMIIPPQQARASPSYLVKGDGTTVEIEPGKPVVILKDPPAAAKPNVQYLVDSHSGKLTEVAAGQPIIIMKEPQPNTSMMTPIQVTDRDGKPMVLDLGTYIKLEEHKEKQKRDQDSHDTKMEIAKEFKDLLKKGANALGRMGDEG